MTRARLQVHEVCKHFSDGLWRPPRQVLQRVSLAVRAGEVVALVGESGSGKSTLARVIAGIERADGGQVCLDGEPVGPEGLRKRGRVQMVFQDPFASLNPVHTIAYHLQRPLIRHRRCAADQLDARVGGLLAAVGLDPAFGRRHPHALSGGQRQRVAIARALAAAPEVILADEPTSMLDVSARLDVLELLRRLADERQLAILLITHDLASAAAIADRVVTLYAGRVVEAGPARTVLSAPAHPYTQLLLAAVPRGERIESTRGKRPAKSSEPAPGGRSLGCPFAPRCPLVHELCRGAVPPVRAISPTHEIICHLHPGAGPAPIDGGAEGPAKGGSDHASLP